MSLKEDISKRDAERWYEEAQQWKSDYHATVQELGDLRKDYEKSLKALEDKDLIISSLLGQIRIMKGNKSV